MKNYNKYLKELNQIKNMATNKQARNDFNNEMVNKTWQYQKGNSTQNTNSSSEYSKDGKWVTINGNHVLIKD